MVQERTYVSQQIMEAGPPVMGSREDLCVTANYASRTACCELNRGLMCQDNNDMRMVVLEKKINIFQYERHSSIQ